MATTGHNSMPDRATFFAHLAKIQQAAGVKAEADADFSQAKKLAKADGIAIEDIKYVMDAIKAEDVETVRARLARQAMYLEWLSILSRGQGDLFADRRPADEASYDAGFAAGLLGHFADAEKGTEWMRGWSDGQAELGKGIKALEAPRVSIVINNDTPAGASRDDDPEWDAAHPAA